RLEEGKAFADLARVVVADAKDNAGEAVRQHGARHVSVAIQLAEFLMRQDEPQAILAGARQNLRHARCNEMLELVGVEPIVLPDSLRLSAHRGLLELGHEQRAEQIRVLLSNLSLGQLSQKDF